MSDDTTDYGRPAQRERFVVEVALGDGMTTPKEVLSAITESIHQYGMTRMGTTTPFMLQPGYPLGDVKTTDGTIVGQWHIEGGF